MPRKVREITDLEIDEISLVDKGANQHAMVTIAKRDEGEKENSMDVYDEQGNLLDPETLSDGDMVFDEDGNGYVIDFDAEGDEDENDDVEEEQERELEAVGKSANPFKRSSVSKKATGGFDASAFRVELSKALTDRDRDEIISKAFGQLETLSKAAEEAQRNAEYERELRLVREYTEVAKSYNMPVKDEALGVALMHAAELLPREDCMVIAKCLEAAGEAMFYETGYEGGGDNSDVFQMVQGYADEAVSKSAGSVDQYEMTTDVFMHNPELYDEYLRERN